MTSAVHVHSSLQQSLDAPLKSPESFTRTHDGVIIRHVRTRDGQQIASEIGLDVAPEESDLGSAADLSFLRRTTQPPLASDNSEEVRVADLFSGCGAMSLGLAEACRALGKRMVPGLVADINRSALEVYARNFGISTPEPIDLGELSSLIHAAKTPAEIRLTRAFHSLDLVVAGPPCQGHSNLNNHTRRNDPKNGLYLKVARFARLFEPRILIVENVPSVVRDKQGVVGRTFQHLQELGYRATHGVVDLSRIGVAQSRKRHVMIAIRSDVAFRLPALPEIVATYSRPARAVGWAIADLQDATIANSLMDAPSQMSDTTRARVEYLFANEQFDLPDDQRPDCHRTKRHTYQAVYGRMKPHLPAPTITSGFNTMGQGRFVHPTRPRTLTPREAARLQFIPDFFSFEDVRTRSKLTEMIGNAVPPKLSYVLGLELLR